MTPALGRIHPGLRGAFFYAAYWGAIGLYEPYLAVYFIRQGLDGAQIGWLAAIVPLCTLVISPLVARLADHFHRRVAFLAAASAGYGAALTLLALPGVQPTFALLAGFVALIGIFRSPIVALADSLIAGMAARHTLDFGSMRLWGSLLFTLTALSFGLVWQRTGFSAMFLAAGLAFLLVVAAALLLEEKPRETTHTLIDIHPPGRLVIEPGVLFLLAATFLIIAALFMAGTFGSIYMDQLGGNAFMIGAMMGIAALGEVPGMRFGSLIARRIGDTNTLLVSYALMTVSLILTGLTRSPNLLLVLAALRGLGFGLLLVCTVVIINNRAPRGYAATYQGILNAACWGLAPLLGGPISGWIFQTYGPPALFITAGSMTLVSSLLILPTYSLWKAR